MLTYTVTQVDLFQTSLFISLHTYCKCTISLTAPIIPTSSRLQNRSIVSNICPPKPIPCLCTLGEATWFWFKTCYQVDIDSQDICHVITLLINLFSKLVMISWSVVLLWLTLSTRFWALLPISSILELRVKLSWLDSSLSLMIDMLAPESSLAAKRTRRFFS